jgi:Golgi phosphoprotein 3 (GPP34)
VGSSYSRGELVTQLGGTGRLADDLYLMAHHEITGKPHLQPRAIGLGLAGGLLAELMLLGKIRIRPEGFVVADRTPPGDELARSVLALVLSEHERHAAQRWLLFLARTAAADVAGRLEQSGYLTRTAARRPWRAERWVPVDADCAFAPLVRVRSVLSASQPVAVQSAALAGLATACGLGHQLSMYLPPNARPRLDEAVGQLDPGLRDLIAQTRAAVDSALLSHRV